jgi:hypothetical protein
MYDIDAVRMTKENYVERHLEWHSQDIPDLCAVASFLGPTIEITVYCGNEGTSIIVEQHDEPGEKGNYGGFWHMPPVTKEVIYDWQAFARNFR